ncbi:MAG TPA: glycosyltransferase family 2 protein [Lacunisphaera sp.]
MTISVIIVSWNAKDFLNECLESLNPAASDFPLEIIVVDNASADGSPELVTNKFPHVRLIQSGSNLGFSKANNLGIKQCKGDYVCLINSDVNVLPGSITKLVEYLENNPDVGIAGPSMLDAQGKIGRSCRGFPSVWNMFCHALALDSLFPKSKLFGGYILRYWPQNSTREVGILGGWFWIVRREALDRVGLLDENFFFYAEDMDWCKRFHLGKWKVMFVSSASSIHYGGGSSKQAPLKYYIQQQRADLQYWRKHHTVAGRVAYFGICLLYHATRLVGNGMRALFSGQNSPHRAKAALNWQCLLWYLGGAK